MRIGFAVIAVGLVSAALFSAQSLAEPRLGASVLPTSRYVQTGTTATAFATIINSGDSFAYDCTILPVTAVDAAFEVYQTDPATNAIITPRRSVTDIGIGASASFVFAFTPNSEFAPVDIELEFDCSNTDPARVLIGVNTFTLGVSDDPGADIVALSATIANDGITRTPGPVGTGVFSVATSNIGAQSTITAMPQSTDPGISVALRICETDPATGLCLSPPSSSVTTTATSGGINAFGIFARADGVAALAPATRRIELVFTDGDGVQRGATSVAYTTQTEMGPGGGTLRFDGAQAELDLGTAIGPVDIEITDEGGVPAALPGNVSPAERVRDISVSDVTRLNAPVLFSLEYDEASVDEDNLLVLHYDEAAGTYDIATVRAIDTDANTIDIDARSFSSFATTATNAAALFATEFSVENFEVDRDGWPIANFGSYYNSGGNCLGMAAYAVWWYRDMANGGQNPLSTQYSTAGGRPISIAHLTAARSMLSQNQYWTLAHSQGLGLLSEAQVGRLLQAALVLTGDPQILVLRGPGGAHAIVVYGWNEDGFLAYEVNYVPGDARRSPVIPFDFDNPDNGFGLYNGYNEFSFVSLTSLGRGQDFEELDLQAQAGYPSSDFIDWRSPVGNSIVDDVFTELDVRLSGQVAEAGELILFSNGREAIPLGTNDTIFYRLPVRAGENTAILFAAVEGDIRRGTGFWNWQSADSAVVIREFRGDFRDESPFIATLNYQGEAVLQLFVDEPSSPTYLHNDSRASTAGLRFEGYSNLEDTVSPNLQTVYWSQWHEGAEFIVSELPYRIAVQHLEGPTGFPANIYVRYQKPDGAYVSFTRRIYISRAPDNRLRQAGGEYGGIGEGFAGWYDSWYNVVHIDTLNGTHQLCRTRGPC
ncbi:hypothetical protein [Hyphobacterium sp.]|uniref:hypothetical protein n=1 Tax=Hyphobacterium sp. TaxID=2004662 RepID=UPI00374881AF